MVNGAPICGMFFRDHAQRADGTAYVIEELKGKAGDPAQQDLLGKVRGDHLRVLNRGD